MASPSCARRSRNSAGGGGLAVPDDIESQASSAESSHRRRAADEETSQTSRTSRTSHTPSSAYHTAGSQSEASMTTAPSKGKGKGLRRDQDLQKVFRGLVGHGGTHAGEAAMLAFAQFCKFDDGRKAWALEFREICRQHGWDPSRGINVAEFTSFVNDKESSGFCTGKDIRNLLEEMGLASSLQEEQDQLRSVAIRQMYQAMDPHGLGRIGRAALRPYAELYGFRGSATAWAQEYRFQCERNGWDPDRGLTQTQFAALVAENSDMDHINSAQLPDFLEKLRQQTAAAASHVVSPVAGEQDTE